MARGRVIDKNAVTSMEFYDQPYWAAVLWVWILTNASARGEIGGDVGWLRASALPRENPKLVPSKTQVEGVLDTWQDRGMILYKTREDGRKSLKIKNWHSYQRARDVRDGMGDDDGKDGVSIPIVASSHSKKGGPKRPGESYAEYDERRAAEREKRLVELEREKDREFRREVAERSNAKLEPEEASKIIQGWRERKETRHGNKRMEGQR